MVTLLLKIVSTFKKNITFVTTKLLYYVPQVIKWLNLKQLIVLIRFRVSNYFSFLLRFYHRNELIWVDGFLLDFLQKKSIDLWLRKFVIYTGFLFSERLVFDYVVRIYLDNIIWPLHYIGVSESENVVEMLSTTLYFYFLLFTLVCFYFII